jgi:hypothetical protein
VLLHAVPLAPAIPWPAGMAPMARSEKKVRLARCDREYPSRQCPKPATNL